MTWLDRLFNAAHGRLGAHYVEFWLAVSGVGIALLPWPAQQAVQFLLWGRDASDAAVMALAVVLGFVISAGVMTWVALRPFRPVIRFLRGEPVHPQAVWHAAVRDLPRVAAIAVVAFCTFGNIPVVWAAGRQRGFNAVESVGAWFTASLVTVSAVFFFILIWEAAFRPILRDLDPLLPPGFAPKPHWLTLSRRSMMAVTTVMVYTGITVSGLVLGVTGTAARTWVSALGTLAAASTFGGLITGLVSHSIFSRVSDLKEALMRIGQGDFSVRVPLRMGDELDGAGTVLNEMAARLESHDAQLRESRARLASVEQDERRRIERDLRVGVDQRLERLARGLNDLASTIGPGELAASCSDLRSTLDEARSEIRSLAYGIFPPLLESDGLGAALRDTVKRTGLAARVDLDGVGRLPAEIEAATYFCCSEALQNVVKHAGPDAGVGVRVVVRLNVVQFSVTDDGVGFDGIVEGRGLANMRDRLSVLGGDVSIVSTPGRGTRVTGWLTVDGRASRVRPYEANSRS